jgi:hypothetical protein
VLTHDLPGGEKWNIDHVAVSTRGVFLIETKARRRRTSRNRQSEHVVVYDGKSLRFLPGMTQEQFHKRRITTQRNTMAIAAATAETTTAASANSLRRKMSTLNITNPPTSKIAEATSRTVALPQAERRSNVTTTMAAKTLSAFFIFIFPSGKRFHRGRFHSRPVVWIEQMGSRFVAEARAGSTQFLPTVSRPALQANWRFTPP